jgi:Lon protease-like protein
MISATEFYCKMIKSNMFSLPLLPLNAVLFPEMPLQLHIFEQRYRQMVQECLDNDAMFGIVLLRRGREVGSKDVETFPVGCTAKIDEVSTLPDGRMNMMVLGKQRFRIHSLSQAKPYLTGEAELTPIGTLSEGAATWREIRFDNQVRKYLELLDRIRTHKPDLSTLVLPENQLTLLYLSATVLQIPNHEKQLLLQSQSADHLLHQLQHLYRREITLLSQLYGPERRNKRSTSRRN